MIEEKVSLKGLMMFGSSFQRMKNQLGNFEEINRESNRIFLKFEKGKVEMCIFKGNVFRVRISNEEFEKDVSYAVEDDPENLETSLENLEEKEKKIIIENSEVKLEISKNPIKFSFYRQDEEKPFLEDQEGYSYCKDEDEIRTYKKLSDEEHFYGFGEKTGPLDKRGEYMEMFAGDRSYKKDEDPLYVSIPYFIGVKNKKAYGVFFDNTYRSKFDMGKSSDKHYYFGAEGGELEYYVFPGPKVSEVVEDYTELTGRMELPPKWSIGYHQSRWSYDTQEEVLEIGKTFREKEIPCDSIHLDIDYMDGYRVFTFDEENFPDPKAMVDQLKEWDITPVTIMDPGVKEDEGYHIYDECMEKEYYCKNPEGGPSRSWVWPGICIFPDFTREEVREWWGDKHEFYFDLGIEGIWNDMNEPSLMAMDKFDFLPFDEVILKTFKLYDYGRWSDLMRMRNVYGINENKATHGGFEKHMPDKRPFILSRSGYAGVQKYAAIWTGDNWSAFHQIGLSARMIMNLGLSGVAFSGADIGGFSGFKKFFMKNPDLYKRWIQLGVFYPFSRSHTAKRTRRQEPWSFGEEVEEVSRKYIELRYELLPYLYTQFWKASELGGPILKPLFYNYQEDGNCYDERFEDQFLFGDDILVVPISEDEVDSLEVYLPEEEYWVNYWTGERLEGGQVYEIEGPVEDLPIFVRSGAIIPAQEPVQSTKEEVDELQIRIYPGEGSFSLYLDDGESKGYEEGEFTIVDIEQDFSGGELCISFDESESGFELPYEEFEFKVFSKDVDSIIFNGNEVSCDFDGDWCVFTEDID